MKKFILLFVIAALCAGCGNTGNTHASCENAVSCATNVSPNDVNIKVKKIWDEGKHCAFTSIVKFKDKYYVSFREGESHVFGSDGKAEGCVRILVSDDGEKWESVAFMHKDKYDLRDPKLSVTADGRLMVTIGGSIYDPATKKLLGRKPQVSFSTDGKTFSEPEPIKIKSKTTNGTDWLWRVDWDATTGYGVVYSLLADNPREVKQGAVISLLKTTDGINYEDVANIDLPDFPNETTVRMLSDKRMLMFVREDSGDRQGYWGISNPPYTDWSFKKMGIQVGGPDFIVVGDSSIIAGSRMHYLPGSYKTILYKGTPSGNFQEVCILPSGGDTSYPGFLVVGDELWVSYYSSHETELASVYMAKMPLSMFVDK